MCWPSALPPEGSRWSPSRRGSASRLPCRVHRDRKPGAVQPRRGGDQGPPVPGVPRGDLPPPRRPAGAPVPRGEHKVVHAYEEGEASLERARGRSPVHPRCGTSFLLLFFLVAILVCSLVPTPKLWVRPGAWVLLLPVVAGITYDEVLRLAVRWPGAWWLRPLVLPGLLLQRLTTREAQRRPAGGGPGRAALRDRPGQRPEFLHHLVGDPSRPQGVPDRPRAVVIRSPHGNQAELLHKPGHLPGAGRPGLAGELVGVK